jgi:DNA invertase Pin-like site-specific DNA recombinase
MKTPVAYLRKSRVVNDRHMSWEVQEQKVRDLARQHGDEAALVLLSDWNRSGTKGAEGRPGYASLLAMIEAGQVSALYSYSLSRLGRSVPELRRVIDLCVAHGIPVRFSDGEPREVTSTWGRFMLNILGSVAELEANIASDRSKDTIAARKARGDRIGHPHYGGKPGEDTQAIVDAYREVKSVVGAARLLNTRGVPTRMGGPWSSTSVRELLRRVGEMRATPVRGVKPAAPFYLFRLLTCHCGGVMTGSRSMTGIQAGYVMYKCSTGRTLPDHGKLSVPETALLPVIMAEAARLHVPFSAVQRAEDARAPRAALAAKRQRVIELFADGDIDRAEKATRLAAIDTELDSLDARVAVVMIPQSVDWTWRAEDVNAVLRSLWASVKLGADLRTVSFDWRDPDLRHPTAR